MVDKAYVLLHGLFVCIERGKRLEVYLPRMPGHVYLAGNWLSEASIVEGSSLRLMGVKDTYPAIDAIRNHPELVKFPGVTMNARGLDRQIHAMFDLPRPKKIHPLRILKPRDPQAAAVTVTIECAGTTEDYACPVVADVWGLEYSLSKSQSPWLAELPCAGSRPGKRFPWNLTKNAGRLTAIPVLHIYATSDAAEREKDHLADQYACTPFRHTSLPGPAAVRFRESALAPFDPFAEKNLPEGLSALDLIGLPGRLSGVAQFVDGLKMGNLVNPWKAGGPIDSNPNACKAGGGGGGDDGGG